MNLAWETGWSFNWFRINEYRIKTSKRIFIRADNDLLNDQLQRDIRRIKDNMNLSKMRRKKIISTNSTDLLSFSIMDRLKLFAKIRQNLPIDYPRQFWIEITNECNLRCVMCPVSIGLKRKTMSMSLDSFRKIIDQIWMFKPRIVLHVAGEPLLNKNLFQMIEYAKSKGCWVGMHSNATLLTKEISIRILESSLDFLSFSFDGCTAEVYEQVRVGANFNQVKAQIEEFLELRYARKTKNPFTRIQILIMDKTVSQVNKFIKYWQTTKVDQVKSKLAGSWIGLIGPNDAKLLQRFGHRPCKDIFQKCVILVDGTIVSCCNDIQGRLSLGNILKQPFKDIWHGENYEQVRKHHLNNTIPEKSICHDCAFRWAWSRREQFIRWVFARLFWRNNTI